MIAVLDYGVGNLFSLSSSLAYIGAQSVVTSDADEIAAADKIILPGVGAFGDAMAKLAESGLIPTLEKECKRGAKPLLGICLGMQMLFDKSYEYGCRNGLGFITGSVVPFDLPAGYKVPHMGWNCLRNVKESALTKDISDGAYVYFVHSFHAVNCAENTVAVTDYGVETTAIVQKENIFGTQFHPEKSGETGLKILTAFVNL